MTFDIEVSYQADTDLRSIFEYIAFELQSPVIAIEQLKRIENKINLLNEMPERFQLYREETTKSKEIRQMCIDNYSVFYYLNIEMKKVVIIRVLYNRRNTEKLL